jgi:outer membrane protein OmpA-like peptidoglycan-associated protein
MIYSKKITGSLLFLIAGLSSSLAQNMAINSNMDAKCIPTAYGEIIKTETWTNANGGTVDLFDRNKKQHCNPVNAIPQNYMGYQPATASEQNYAGIIAFYDDGPNNITDSTTYAKLGLKDGYKKYSEYLEGELAEPLIAGKVYQVSFKVNLANKSGRAVSCLGALLSVNKIEQKSNSFLTETPQFISHRVITDTLNWITLYGAYIAAGGEKFITIGCFKDDQFEEIKVVDPMQNDSRKAYYYLADISVTPYIAKPYFESLVYGVDFIELMDLQFANANNTIEPQYNSELDEVANWMISHPEMSFFIAGYTDKTGSNAINDPLSVSRAKEVKKYLVSKGVKEANIITEGFGSKNPIEHKIKSSKNRRVEIYLYAVNKV